MNQLAFQAAALVALSAPFAWRGWCASDMAAWATAFLALLAGIAILGLAWTVENGDC